MKLLIVRHADPDYSIDSLTETGWKEAQLLAGRLEKLDIQAFYVSSMGRARDTASLTLKAMGKEATVCDWLREFGPHFMKPYEKILHNAWDWLPEWWTTREGNYNINTWANWEQFQGLELAEKYRYVAENLDALLAKHGYVREGKIYRTENANEDTVVLVCHFGVECVLLSHLLGVSPMALWHGTCALPSSVTTLVTEERRKGIASFRMLSFGDTSHLYVADREPSFAGRFCEIYENFDQRHD